MHPGALAVGTLPQFNTIHFYVVISFLSTIIHSSLIHIRCCPRMMRIAGCMQESPTVQHTVHTIIMHGINNEKILIRDGVVLGSHHKILVNKSVT